MDFELSEEQRLLKDAADRFVAEAYGFAERMRLVRTDLGFSEANWARFADLGWLSLGFDETHGGVSDARVEAMILAEAFGRGLVAEPFYSTLIAGRLVASAGSDAQQAEVLPRLIAGGLRLALATAEPGGRYNLADLETTVLAEGDGLRLRGRKAVVFDAPSAEVLVVSAREARGVSLLLVPNAAPGVERRDFVTTDGRRASEVRLDNVRLPAAARLGGAGEGLSHLEAAADEAVALGCADAIGAMDHLFATTLAHVKTRRQFGAPIGSFQAVQHRLADLFAELELARSMAIYANLALDAAPPERARAVSLAKIQVIEAARRIGRQAIQLHGGIGMTNELHVGHYFKRLLAFETLYGDADHHAARVERLAA